METYVDIYDGPGINLEADACLRLAEQHGARGVVAHLLPRTVHGPGYVRGIHQVLAAAMYRFRPNQVDMANFHLDNAIRCQPTSTRTQHRSGTPPTPTRTTTSGTATPAGTDPVEVHIYDAPPSKALIPSRALSTDKPIAAGGSADIDMHGNPAVPDTSWQRQLRDAAHAGNVTAVTVSDPRQVRPEHRVDHRRRSQTARQAAAAADPDAPWVALHPRPDAAVVPIGASVRPSPARHQRPAAARSVLHRPPAGHTHPPPAGSTPTPIPRRANDLPSAPRMTR